ncbi:pollen-specific leucine-rich repeat extensin-like protein 3 [Iris pallida]|uniref:Pollen-specific leucine-rich repeat extensin-like protein 3 n=1 Tax=Iris pallida TaxID=29817 RepID=A0AAX6EWK1_IRIPA|nr:pollen-specific leucine-rich repeat extensin-like protein 3 [Iris pallida]
MADVPSSVATFPSLLTAIAGLVVPGGGGCPPPSVRSAPSGQLPPASPTPFGVFPPPFLPLPRPSLSWTREQLSLVGTPSSMFADKLRWDSPPALPAPTVPSSPAWATPDFAPPLWWPPPPSRRQTVHSGHHPIDRWPGTISHASFRVLCRPSLCSPQVGCMEQHLASCHASTHVRCSFFGGPIPRLENADHSSLWSSRVPLYASLDFSDFMRTRTSPVPYASESFVGPCSAPTGLVGPLLSEGFVAPSSTRSCSGFYPDSVSSGPPALRRCYPLALPAYFHWSPPF